MIASAAHADAEGVGRRSLSAEPLGEFLRKTPDSKGRSYTRADLRRRGYSFLLDVRAEGPPGTRLRLRTFQRLDDGGRIAGFASEKDSAPFEHFG